MGINLVADILWEFQADIKMNFFLVFHREMVVTKSSKSPENRKNQNVIDNNNFRVVNDRHLIFTGAPYNQGK